ncbi:zinc finger CCCH-type antiviral protein 1-like isoform X2 [Hyperolius riggenbachi]|uniref:zinc finger CCCH-type antiviral protein 1-like isoform X2 n=1 Tax=Hyperolius riggenbachi TaxID=752182 RepID=UPI0035A3B79E
MPRCRFSHNVLSDHNRIVLKSNELSGLDEKEVKVLLFQNDIELLPEHCKKYNYDQCDLGGDCSRLHVCGFFLRGECKNRFCKKSHDLVESISLLSCQWLSAEAIQNFQMLCMLNHNERMEAQNRSRKGDAKGAKKTRGKRGGQQRNRYRNGSNNWQRQRKGSNLHPQSSSHSVSKCNGDQDSELEADNKSDKDSDYDENCMEMTLDNLMKDWFNPSITQPGNVQIRSSVTAVEGLPQARTQSVPSNDGSLMTSRRNEPVSLPEKPPSTAQTQETNSRKLFHCTTAQSSTSKKDIFQSPISNLQPVLSHKLNFGKNDPMAAGAKPTNHIRSISSNVLKTSVISVKEGPSVYNPTPLTASSRPLENNPYIEQSKPVTTSNTTVNSLVECTTTSKPNLAIRNIEPIGPLTGGSSRHSSTPSTSIHLVCQSKGSQYSRHQEFGSSDNDSVYDHKEEVKRIDNLMADWFSINTTQSAYSHVRHSVTFSGVSPPGATKFEAKSANYNPSITAHMLNTSVSSSEGSSVYHPPPLMTPISTTSALLKDDPCIAPTKSSTAPNLSTEYPLPSQPKPVNAPCKPSSPFTTVPAVVPFTSTLLLNRSVSSSVKGPSNAKASISLLPASPKPTTASNTTDSSEKKTFIPQQNQVRESHKTTGSIVFSPLATSTYSKPADSAVYCQLGSSSSLKTLPLSSILSAASIPTGTSSRKLQASVEPVKRSSSTSGYRNSAIDRYCKDFHPVSKSTESSALQTQPCMNISSVLPRASTQEKSPEICLTNAWKYCKLEDKCPNMHYYLPYRWQVFSRGNWEDLPNMEAIEKAYSDPKVDSYKSVCFQTMTSDAKPVRRLSTPSSVTKPPDYVLTTEWIWWRGGCGSWSKYGDSNTRNLNSAISMSDLENIYLSDPTGIIPITEGNKKYIVNFQEMKQREAFSLTEVRLRRRPRFLDFENVKMLKGSTKFGTASSPLRTELYPPQWEMLAMKDVGYKKALVPKTSVEFLKIDAMFSTTVTGHTVWKLWRVQNPALWEAYQRQKDQMKRRSDSKINECQLFHGTTSTNANMICSQNFDRNTNGNIITMFGKGSYFFKDAFYAHKHTQPTSDGIRSMFVARVLVGDFAKGEPMMTQPPQKHNSSQSYDSCVDNIRNPSIFVVFNKLQMYPEYLLEYKEKKSCSIM